MTKESIRDYLTPEQRALPLELTIDPGFVHKRKIQTILGSNLMRQIDARISELSPLAGSLNKVRIDHIYKDHFLKFCKHIGVKTLQEILNKKKGNLFCSIETLSPCKHVFDQQRAVSICNPIIPFDKRIELHYSTNLVTADTLKSKLCDGYDIALVAELHNVANDFIEFHPILMGFPWLQSNDSELQADIEWSRYEFFEHFVEDFDEFSKVKSCEKPQDFSPMEHISENAFKRALATLLGDSTTKDWGGETSDHFTSHIHLNGKRVNAAFLLKGPARFSPMGLNHLGKNNDQIVRLATEPADVLIVQHCHEILPAVRTTLRAFAVQPYRSKRYCLIDGRDSFWLLKAYGLYESAKKWSEESKKLC